MSLYHLRDVKQTYSGRVVLDIANLTIAPGEIFAVVGPSGSGKSTLLRLLNGLEAPSQGQVFLSGQLLSPDAPLEVLRRVTMVFQQPILLNRSLRENVNFGLRLRGWTPDTRVDAVLERVGLTALASQAAHKLSGGELQRAALARTLVLNPDVLLLDEPTANLDPYNVTLIESIIRQHNQEYQTTVVLVTHNVFQARRLAHRVGFLLEGQLVEVAATDVFFDSPRDPRTSAFVRGEMVY
jgi:tungstate transport system ATP-binding protein